MVRLLSTSLSLLPGNPFKKSNPELTRDIKIMPRVSHEHFMQRLTLLEKLEKLVAEDLAMCFPSPAMGGKVGTRARKPRRERERSKKSKT